MDTDSLPELHSSSIQPTSPKNLEENPFNDILSEAIQIAKIEYDQEYGLDELSDLLDTHAENLNHSYVLLDNHANTTNDDTVNIQATEITQRSSNKRNDRSLCNRKIHTDQRDQASADKAKCGNGGS